MRTFIFMDSDGDSQLTVTSDINEKRDSEIIRENVGIDRNDNVFVWRVGRRTTVTKVLRLDHTDNSFIEYNLAAKITEEVVITM